MRELDTINRQQNYCSTMRIKLGGQTMGVKPSARVDACTWLQAKLGGQAKGVKPSVLGGRLLAAASQRSARDAFGS